MRSSAAKSRARVPIDEAAADVNGAKQAMQWGMSTTQQGVSGRFIEFALFARDDLTAIHGSYP